jgi:hypothetical protein
MFSFITLLLEMTESQIYVLTRSTILLFVRYMLLEQLFCKTKVIANLQLEAGQNFYDVLWIRRSSYCFIYILSFKSIIYSFSEFTIKCEILFCIIYLNFIKKRCLFSKKIMICTKWYDAVEIKIWYDAVLFLSVFSPRITLAIYVYFTE